MSNKTDEEWYTFRVGVSLICIGGVGVILNSIALLYFCRMKTTTENSLYSKISFINLAVVDLILSLSVCLLRGPGYVWPDVIWGNVVYKGTGNNTWCEAGDLILWVLSDVNLLGVIPLSMLFFLLHAPCFTLSKLNMALCIVLCWCIPLVELIFILILTSTGELVFVYKKVYGRCTLQGNYEHVLNYENSAVFFAAPLFIHLSIWGYIIYSVCRQGNTFYNKQWLKFLKTGVIIIVTFTATWLPYFIVVPWQDIEPTGGFAVVYCFLYSSVILNPIIYCGRSMKFNGKTMADIVTGAAISSLCRSRTVSGPVPDVKEGAGRENLVYSSYDDVSEEGEMKSAAP